MQTVGDEPNDGPERAGQSAGGGKGSRGVMQARGSIVLAITLVVLVLAIFSTDVSAEEAIVVTVLALLIFVSRNV